MASAECKRAGGDSGKRYPGWWRRDWTKKFALVFVGLGIASLLSACNRDLECSDSSVQTALGQALDELYAQSRALAKVDLTLKDIVAMQQSPQSASCKALVHLEIDFVGQKQSRDATIPYTAEITDKGNVLVTLQE